MGKKAKAKKSRLEKFKKFGFNKYILTLVAFIVWISIFDKYNLFNQGKLSREISKLEKEQEQYEQKLAEARLELKKLKENKEKYAREKHLFHKEGEDILVIEKDNEKE